MYISICTYIISIYDIYIAYIYMYNILYIFVGSPQFHQHVGKRVLTHVLTPISGRCQVVWLRTKGALRAAKLSDQFATVLGRSDELKVSGRQWFKFTSSFPA